jgi:hypothetical protein
MTLTRIASARQVLLRSHPVTRDDEVSLELSFFKSIALPNGTHKTTASARLADVDQLVCDCLESRRTIRLLDVGISSGVTTLDLLNRFESRGIQTSGVGVDICTRGLLASFLGLDVLYDTHGNVLQVATPFFARGRPHRSQRSLRSKLLGFGMDVLESALVGKWLRSGPRSLPLDLVSPRLLARANFSVVEHDIALARPEWDHSFDLVRAANILNLDYFSQSHILMMVTQLVAWLKTGALLLICRTSPTDGSNHGSVYLKQESAPYLKLAHRIGAGSELDPVISALCAEPSTF